MSSACRSSRWARSSRVFPDSGSGTNHLTATLTATLAATLGFTARDADMGNEIEAMEREETTYWLVMVMHRPNPHRVLTALWILLTVPKATGRRS